MTAISQSDVLFKLSAPNATAGNVVAGYPGTSWGGYLSTTVLPSTSLDNLFNDITGAENAAGQVDYACLFVQNNTATGNTMMNSVAWLPSAQFTGTGTSIAIAADPAGLTSVNSGFLQAARIQSSVIPPSGVSGWTAPANLIPTAPNYTGGVVLGNVSPGQCIAIWIRRTALNSSLPSLNTLNLQVIFNTKA